jgi:hypothetical protein
MRPEVARDALLATHGGLSLELCAVIGHISPMAVYRLVCSFGHQALVPVLSRCGLPLPRYLLADEKHSKCLTDKVYLPTIVSGRVMWHLDYSDAKSAVAFSASYGTFQRAALEYEPSYRVQGALIDGFDSTTKAAPGKFEAESVASAAQEGSVAKFDFWGKIQKSGIRNSMTYRLPKARPG